MIHARKDYDPIQDPSGKIPEDEPVFLLRAKDVTAPEVVEYWAKLAEEAGALENITDAADRQAQAMRQWQKEHGTDVPDMPMDANKVG